MRPLVTAVLHVNVSSWILNSICLQPRISMTSPEAPRTGEADRCSSNRPSGSAKEFASSSLIREKSAPESSKAHTCRPSKTTLIIAAVFRGSSSLPAAPCLPVAAALSFPTDAGSGHCIPVASDRWPSSDLAFHNTDKMLQVSRWCFAFFSGIPGDSSF